MANRYKRVEWGAGNDRVRTAPGTWAQPLRWDRMAHEVGKPAFVFCLSLGDIWDNEVDPTWRRDAFAVMERTPHLIYLLLSKRIGNARKMCNVMAGHSRLPPNAALGATVINQPEWDRDVWKLLDAADVLGARFTFCSVEPMLGPIKVRRSEMPSWVICGGESGPRKRPMDLTWARSLRDQCQAAEVRFFMKQIDKVLPIPADLMIREMPHA